MLLHKNLFFKSYKYSIILLLFFIFCNLNAKADEIFTSVDLNEAKKQAYALYNLNENDEALKIFEKIDKNYRDETMWLIIANIYEDKGDIDSAISTLSNATRINSKFYKAYYNLGCLFMKKKEYDLALLNFNLSLNKNNNFAYAHYNMGCIYLEKKEYKKAKRQFVLAYNLKRDDKNILYNLAYSYKMLNDVKNAEKIIKMYDKM